MTISIDDNAFSISPIGEKFPLPSKHEYADELKRLRALTDRARSQQKEIVVVTGEELSTPVLAAIIANSKNSCDLNSKFVIWYQNPTPENYWKIPLFNRGMPLGSEPPQVSELIFKAAIRTQNLTATYNADSLCLADCIIVDIQCNDLDQPDELFSSEFQAQELKKTMKIIGERISPYCLILINSFTAPGVTEFVAYPVLKEEFEIREIETNHFWHIVFQRQIR
jgi:hypothetical protein